MSSSESSWSSILERHTIGPSKDVVPFLVGRNIVLNLEPESRDRERDSSRASSKQLCATPAPQLHDKSNYTGRILSVRGRMVAYRLYNQNVEAVRVLDRETRTRHLIKDFRARTVDIQWAVHANLLAVVDSDACLHVYQVDDRGEECGKFLNIMRDKSQKPLPCKIVWCPTQNPDHTDPSEFALLALYYGRRVELIDLAVIKKALKSDNVEIDMKQLADIPEAFRTITLDTPISSVKISPDASALVVCTTTGKLIFYITSEKELRTASEFEPIQNHAAENVIFLDDLSVTNPECFWRYAVVSTDNGRKLWLFDCDDFTLVGKARIDAPGATNPLEIVVDFTSKYLFVIDYDAKNLFAFEIAFVNGVPHFAGVTMVAFYNQLYIAVPVAVEDNLDETGLSLDDDDDAITSMTALFVAISSKALLEIRVDLDKTLNFAPATSYKPLAIADNVSENIAPDNDGNTSNISSSAKSTHSRSGGQQSAVEFAKLSTIMEERFDTMNIRFDEIKDELETVKLELQNVKADTRSDLVTALEGISNELKTRDDRINDSISNGFKRIKDEISLKIEEAAKQSHQRMDLNRERCLDVISNTMSHVVVPSLEVLCREMFKQLNEQLNVGLMEFNDQLKRVQSELVAVASSTAPTPVPDTIGTIVQLIEAEKFEEAFEVALQQRDLSGLMTICTRINIDDFFEGTPLTVPRLLEILELLSTKLNQETTMKLHVAELVLMVTDIGDDMLMKASARDVLADFITALDELQKPDSATKRQIRIVMQLATNLMKTTSVEK